MINRIALKEAFSTIGCGFGAAAIYRQLRSVKNCFRWKVGEPPIFVGGRRVWGMPTVGHIVELAPQKLVHKGEQFTPELLWLIDVGSDVRRVG